MAGPASLTATVDAACDALAGGLSAVAASPTAPGTVAEWAAAMAALQRLLDVATAAQDVTICRLASIEVDQAEDGTLRERHRPPGHVSLDAAPVVSGVLGATSVHAERRVRAAVARVADGSPGTGAATGFGGLHAAMAAGRLDPYRADVVAAELEEAPAEVVATVVAALEPYLDTETGPQLRRRCRRLLARISPDLLRQRARRARAGSRLERWATEPGVDTWHGTFPSEEAALAWAAVDALAQRYVADGTCATVDRARAKALTDLVTGNADVSAEVVLTVPHPDTEPGTVPRHPDDLVEVPGLRPSEPLLVRRGWLGGLTRAAAAAAATTPSRRAARRLRVRACHPGNGAALADLPPADAPHTDPPPTDLPPADLPPADLPPADLPHTDALQTDRPATGVPLASASVAEARGPRRGSDAGPYRPPRPVAELVRSRDGHCRFPGCHVSARFCDLDHVRPWPTGPTTAGNLMCLCRRHHRTKQRPGWRVRIRADATVAWTDPTGRTRTTHPLDALHPVVLPHAPGEPRYLPHTPRLVVPDGPHSVLEFTLEHLAAAAPGPRPGLRICHEHRGHRHRAGASAPPEDPPF
jgi:hypothetical protein